MGIEKLGIRWGRGQKRQQRKERDLQRVIAGLESEIDDLDQQVKRLELIIDELATETGVYLPSFSGRTFR